MRFNITAISNGKIVFQGTMGYIPRKGEHIEMEGYTYVVENVIHILKRGMSYDNNVQLLVKYIGT